MSLSLNYVQLVSTLESWCEDATSDFSSQIDTIIGAAELQILRELPLTIFDQTANPAIAGGSNLITKPAGYLGTVGTMTYVNGSGQVAGLLPRSLDWVRDYGGVGDPLYIAEYSDTQWLVAPGPNVNRTATLQFIKRPAQLSTNTTTTWLSTNVGDLLLYACLVNSEQFLMADERVATWNEKYKELLEQARIEHNALLRATYPK